MARARSDVQLSVLDLSVLNEGSTSTEALAATTQLARAADRLGFLRFWVAEHHNMPSVVSTSPPVLIAHLAASTERIRVGSGGVMLPNHPPLVVAEHFAMLEALHPGRIDLGIGRAPGTDPSTARALRRTDGPLGADDFPSDLLDVMGLLGDPRTADGLWEHFAATPAAATRPDVWLLGSSDYSAQLAGLLGLPFGFAHHFDMGGTLQAAELYVRSFRPSPALESPWLLVTANVLAAATPEEAEHHALSARITLLGRRTGRFVPLPSPEAAAVHPWREGAGRLPTNRIVGTGADVAEQLAALAERTGADELMITSVAHSVEARIRSLELVMEAWRDG